MRKFVSFFCLFVVSVSLLHAQAPILTQATNSPVAGDGFFGHMLNTAGLTMGGSGTGVIWNYTTVIDTAMDTNYYYSCPPTPFCDSFPGSNIVSYNNSSYTYMLSDASRFSEIGGGNTDTTLTHFDGYFDILVYPFTYLNTHKDTASYSFPAGSFTVYLTIMDSFIADAYGTLMLPTGTYSNVLRLHRTILTRDSVNFLGTTMVNLSQTETYWWFNTTGFHNPLFEMTYDTTGVGVPYVSAAQYYTAAPPLGVKANASANKDGLLSVYPNPAIDMININFDIPDSKNAAVALCDLSGRVVISVSGDHLHAGMNVLTIPTATLPAGMYMVRLQSIQGNAVRKIVVER